MSHASEPRMPLANPFPVAEGSRCAAARERRA